MGVMRVIVRWAAVWCGLAAIAATALIAQALPETVVKAAFVRRFPEFVHWPPSAADGKSPLELCLSPTHQFGTLVRDITTHATVRGRTVKVRELRPGDHPDSCQVLYVGPADQAILYRAKNLPILTVGDQDDFCQLGGILNLRVIDGRVRFEVGLAQAKRVGLLLDSQLLRLATRLYGEER